MDLRRARDFVFGNRPAQTAVRRAARMRLLPRWICRRLQPLGPHPLATPAGNSFTYVADGRDQLARSIVWRPVWERGSLRVFSELARDAGTVIDGGAHTGVYSLVAATDSGAQVISVEPNPAILPNLRRNIAINGYEDRIEVVEAALSSAPGKTTLSSNPDISAVSIGGADGPRAQVVTLDQIAGGRKVGLIKLDIEGEEARALQGATRLLDQKPHLIVEILSQAAFEEVAAFLADFGYRSIRWLGETPQPVTRKVNQPGETANYHFAPDS